MPLLQTAVLLFNLILCLVLWMLLAMLLWNTVKNVISNCTSVEQMEVISEGRRVGGIEKVRFPFNISLMYNMRIVLGPSILLWPFPLPSSHQIDPYYDGLTFMTTYGEDCDWPPVEYCSDSSCETSPDIEQGAQGGCQRFHGSRSDTDLRDTFRQRARRDSEGFVLPSTLPWHHDGKSTSNPDLSTK